MDEKLLRSASESGLFELLNDSLGYTRDIPLRLNPSGLADFGKFRGIWKRYPGTLEESGFSPAEQMEIIAHFAGLVRNVFASATRFYVSAASLFHIKEYSVSTPDLSYSVPAACTGCSDEPATKKKKVYYRMESAAGIRQIITLEFPFCRRCARSSDLFITTVTSFGFTNPSYGYAFAIMNDVQDYRISFSEDDLYRKVEKKLSKAGRQESCRGIPWSSVSDFPEF